MPNFAQEFPCLLFLPLIILVLTALVSGVVHLAVRFNTDARPAQVAAVEHPKLASASAGLLADLVLATTAADLAQGAD